MYLTESVSQYFNPRPREGGDFKTGCGYVALMISIHAPARGATSWAKSIIDAM